MQTSYQKLNIIISLELNVMNNSLPHETCYDKKLHDTVMLALQQNTLQSPGVIEGMFDRL